LRLTVPSVYDRIKRSNSSLNRKSKKLLEDSIERVLEVVKSDALGDDDSDSVDGDFQGLEDGAVIPVGVPYSGRVLPVAPEDC
jgi:ribosome biogenesis ATPase